MALGFKGLKLLNSYLKTEIPFLQSRDKMMKIVLTTQCFRTIQHRRAHTHAQWGPLSRGRSNRHPAIWRPCPGGCKQWSPLNMALDIISCGVCVQERRHRIFSTSTNVFSPPASAPRLSGTAALNVMIGSYNLNNVKNSFMLYCEAVGVFEHVFSLVYVNVYSW